MLCARLFLPLDRRPRKATFAFTGGTDNQSTPAAVARLMTGKFPLNLVLMELACLLAERQCDLQLSWRPREMNTEADALTNSDFRLFDPSLRIPVKLEALEWNVLTPWWEESLSLYREVAEARKAARSRKPSGETRGRKRRSSLKVDDPW